MDDIKIVITDLQMICPAGDKPELIFDSLLKGQIFLKKHEQSDDIMGGDGLTGRVEQEFKKELEGKGWRHHNRSALMACLAGKRIFKTRLSVDHPICQPENAGLVLAYNHNVFSEEVEDALAKKSLHLINPANFLTMSTNAVASQVSIYLNIQGFTITQTMGYLAGLESLATAALTLNSGRSRVVLAGGAEEIIPQIRYSTASYNRNVDQALLFSGIPGMPVSEGCALLQCEKGAPAKDQGRPARAVIRGFGMYFNPAPQSAHDPEAARQAIQKALQDAGIHPKDVGVVFTATNGNTMQDLAEARALYELFGEQMPPAFALRSTLGEGFHASGALVSALAVVCLEQGSLPPNQNLTGNEWIEKLNLSDQKRNHHARYALVMGMEHQYKSGALVLSVPTS